MIEKVTLASDELKQFQDLREEIIQTVSILGDLEYRKTLLDFEIENLKSVMKQNATKERTLLTEFGNKYGNGSINPETGEITPV